MGGKKGMGHGEVVREEKASAEVGPMKGRPRASPPMHAPTMRLHIHMYACMHSRGWTVEGAAPPFPTAQDWAALELAPGTPPALALALL